MQNQVLMSRSNQQNKYYFGVLLPRICAELYMKTDEIFTKEELHQLFKHLYGVASTRYLSQEKFSEYIEAIIDKCINTFKISPIVFNEDLDTYYYKEKRERFFKHIQLKNELKETYYNRQFSTPLMLA